MDTAHFKDLLTTRKRELEEEIARAGQEAVATPPAEVGDETDLVTTTQQQTTLLDQSSLAYRTLTEVNNALLRIETGEYGKCVECGREIQPARLEAVPWAAYCIEDQQKLEQREGVTTPTL